MRMQTEKTAGNPEGHLDLILLSEDFFHVVNEQDSVAGDMTDASYTAYWYRMTRFLSKRLPPLARFEGESSDEFLAVSQLDVSKQFGVRRVALGDIERLSLRL